MRKYIPKIVLAILFFVGLFIFTLIQFPNIYKGMISTYLSSKIGDYNVLSRPVVEIDSIDGSIFSTIHISGFKVMNNTDTAFSAERIALTFNSFSFDDSDVEIDNIFLSLENFNSTNSSISSGGIGSYLLPRRIQCNGVAIKSDSNSFDTESTIIFSSSNNTMLINSNKLDADIFFDYSDASKTFSDTYNKFMGQSTSLDKYLDKADSYIDNNILNPRFRNLEVEFMMYPDSNKILYSLISDMDLNDKNLTVDSEGYISSDKTINIKELDLRTSVAGINISGKCRYDRLGASLSYSIYNRAKKLLNPFRSKNYLYQGSLSIVDFVGYYSVDISYESNISDDMFTSSAHIDKVSNKLSYINGKYDLSDINDYNLFDVASLNVDNAIGEYTVNINNESYHIDINGQIKNFILDESRIDELEIDIDIESDLGSMHGAAMLHTDNFNLFSYELDEVDLYYKSNKNYNDQFTFTSFYNGSKILLIGEIDEYDSIFIENFAVESDSDKIAGENIKIQKHSNAYVLNNTNILIGEDIINVNGSFLGRDNFFFELRYSNLRIRERSLLAALNFGGDLHGYSSVSRMNNVYTVVSKTRIDKGRIDNLYFDSMDFYITNLNDRLIINNLNLESKLGSIYLNGFVDNIFSSNTNNINLSGSLNNFQIASFKDYIPIKYRVDGEVTGSFSIQNLLDDPIVDIDMVVNRPTFDLINGKSLSGKIRYSNNRVYTKNLKLVTDIGEYTAKGSFPVESGKYSVAEILNQPIDFFVNGTAGGFEFLPPYIDSIDSLRGDITMQLGINGTLNNPIRDGFIRIDNGSAHLLDLNNHIKDISGDLSMSNNRLRIVSLNGALENEVKDSRVLNNFFKKNNTKKIQNISVNGSINLSSFFNPDYSLLISGNNVYVENTNNLFSGHGNAEINITGRDTVHVDAIFKPSPYDFEIKSLDFSSSYISNDDIASGTTYKYDIQVPIYDEIRLNTDNFNVRIDGDISLSSIGNSPYSFAGILNILEGDFSDYQGNQFYDATGTIILDPIENNPFLEISASTSISEQEIDISFIGFLDNPELVLQTESDLLSRSDMIELIAFRDTEIGRDNIYNTDRIRSFLTSYLENEIEKNVTKYSIIDEFQFKTTSNVLDEIDESKLNIYLGKKISDKIYLNTELDLENLDNVEYEVEYKINKNIFVVARLDNENRWHFRFKLKSRK